MKNLFSLFAVAAAMTLVSCQAPAKKDCTSCKTACDKKPAAACCGKDGKCCKDGAHKH